MDAEFPSLVRSPQKSSAKVHEICQHWQRTLIGRVGHGTDTDWHTITMEVV